MSALIYYPIAYKFILYPRALNHAAFRKDVIDALLSVYPGLAGKLPLSLVQATQACSLVESSYGQGWKPPGNGSNNTGATQTSCSNPNSFEYVDTHPNPDGTSTAYSVCFEKFPSLKQGLIKQIGYQYRSEEAYRAAMTGDLYGVSSGMKHSGYYEGFGKDEAARIGNHFKAMKSAVLTQAQALNEPASFYERGTLPTTTNPMSTASKADSSKTIAALVMAFGLYRMVAKK